MGKTVVTVESLKHMGLKNTSAFIKDLESLNHAIADAQKAADVPCVVVGGLLYGHLIPDFHLSPVTPDADWKRASFCERMRRRHPIV